jgi:hypothetical protein
MPTTRNAENVSFIGSRLSRERNHRDSWRPYSSVDVRKNKRRTSEQALADPPVVHPINCVQAAYVPLVDARIVAAHEERGRLKGDPPAAVLGLLPQSLRASPGGSPWPQLRQARPRSRLLSCGRGILLTGRAPSLVRLLRLTVLAEEHFDGTSSE